MAAIKTGLDDHRDQTPAEKAAGVAPPEVVIKAAEILAMRDAIDGNADLHDALVAIVAAHIDNSDIHGAGGSTAVSEAYAAWVQGQGGNPASIDTWIRSFTLADITQLQSDLGDALQDITGESLLDLSDVAGTPANGQALVYNTANSRWEPAAVSSVDGVTDHGLLDGLADDDHTQYHTDTRGDARYYTKTQADTLLDAKEPSITKATGFNKAFGTTAGTVAEGNDARLSDARAPTAHTHSVVDISDFDPADYASTGVAEAIRHSADSALSLPVSPYHTQPHVIDASRTKTATDGDGVDYVKHTLVNPTAANQTLVIDADGPLVVWVEGLIDGDATGIYIYQDQNSNTPSRRSVKLFSGDGSGGWVLYG